MARLYILVSCFFLLLIHQATAQTTGSLAGKVTNGKGIPIQGAIVKVLGTSPARGAVTKADGSFLIAGLRADIYDIQITAIGYSTYIEKDVRISVDIQKVVHVKLSESAVNGDTAIVQPDRGNPARNGIMNEEMMRSARTNIQGAVALGPSGEYGVDGYCIRGGRATEAAIRTDGIEVSDPLRGGFGGSGQGAGSVPTVSSGFGAEYGDILPGTVDPGAGELNRQGHAAIVENGFKAISDERFSTFAIDVDQASYTMLRRYTSIQQLPPADAVRIEEMINYFTYDYPDPAGKAPFSINTEVSICPWKPEHRLVHIGLQGKRMHTADLPPSNLVFLLDVSGSMQSPDRLPLLKKAFSLLVEQLRPQDRIAIVTYAGAAGLVLPSTSGAEKGKILAALESLSAGGSTAGGAGILLAYKTAAENFVKEGNNRVILATDGDFNVGVSSGQELEKLITEKRSEGVFLTVLGVGTDNYQDARMETLADKGNGNYSYLDRLEEAERVLVAQMGATLVTIAKDVKIQVEFNPELVKSYRLIGYENRMLKREDFHDDTKDAGELGAGHSVTALYEVELVSMDADPQAPEAPRTSPESEERPTLSGLEYHGARIRPASYGGDTLMYVKFRYKEPADSTSHLLIGPVLDDSREIASASDNFRFSAAVAQLGMLLRSSEHKGDASYDKVIELATGATGNDPTGARAEFISIVQRCRALSGTASR